MAGYSPNPLVKKLGVKANQKLLLLNVPDNYLELIGDWPPGISLLQLEDATDIDFVHFFAANLTELEDNFPVLKSMLKKDVVLWISWPKGSSNLHKDLNGNDVRRIGLESDLVDIKVCAIDEDWSGLKFMYRRSDRL